MSPLRLTLVALLLASTALFAVGAIAERSSHTEPANVRAQESGEFAEGEHHDAAPEATHTGVALLAIAVAVLHLAAAVVAALLSARARHPGVGRAGTMAV